MFSCVVELFGVPSEVTELAKVEVKLDDSASLKELVREIRRKIPGLIGEVISPGKDTLTEAYAFNINGEFQHDDKDVKLHDSDRVAIILLTTGG